MEEEATIICLPRLVQGMGQTRGTVSFLSTAQGWRVTANILFPIPLLANAFHFIRGRLGHGAHAQSGHGLGRPFVQEWDVSNTETGRPRWQHGSANRPMTSRSHLPRRIGLGELAAAINTIFASCRQSIQILFSARGLIDRTPDNSAFASCDLIQKM